jgi:hypothetical protein
MENPFSMCFLCELNGLYDYKECCGKISEIKSLLSSCDKLSEEQKSHIVDTYVKTRIQQELIECPTCRKKLCFGCLRKIVVADDNSPFPRKVYQQSDSDLNIEWVRSNDLLDWGFKCPQQCNINNPQSIENVFMYNYDENWIVKFNIFMEGRDTQKYNGKNRPFYELSCWARCNYCNFFLISKEHAVYHRNYCEKIQCEYCRKRMNISSWIEHQHYHVTLTKLNQAILSNTVRNFSMVLNTKLDSLDNINTIDEILNYFFDSLI